MRTDLMKATVWGAIGGVIGSVVLGFGWAGWKTSTTAELIAKTRSEAAVVSALHRFARVDSSKCPMLRLSKRHWHLRVLGNRRSSLKRVPGRECQGPPRWRRALQRPAWT
jgi:hypothetical protein